MSSDSHGGNQSCQHSWFSWGQSIMPAQLVLMGAINHASTAGSHGGNQSCQHSWFSWGQSIMPAQLVLMGAINHASTAGSHGGNQSCQHSWFSWGQSIMRAQFCTKLTFYNATLTKSPLTNISIVADTLYVGRSGWN